jgi:hypothetical protein
VSEGISIQGRRIFINIPVSWKNPAVKMSNGRMRLNSPGAQAVYAKTGSWIEKDPGVQFGTQVVHGHATVVLDLDELRSLAFRASRNTSKKAKQGPAKAQFFGTSTFEGDFNG